MSILTIQRMIDKWDVLGSDILFASSGPSLEYDGQQDRWLSGGGERKQAELLSSRSSISEVKRNSKPAS